LTPNEGRSSIGATEINYGWVRADLRFSVIGNENFAPD